MIMRSLTKQLAFKLCFCGVFLMIAGGAQAGYFDAANGTTWDANTTALWSTSGTAGTYNQTWTAAGGGAGALATFQGAANTVSLSGAVTAGALDFAVTGYTLAGSGTLTLGSPGTVTVGSGSGAISAVIAGGSLTKEGSGTLVLSSPNSYSGQTIISNGTLQLVPIDGALLNVQVSRDASKAYTGQGYVPSPGNNTWNFLLGVNASSSLNYADGQAATGLSVLIAGGENYDGQGADASLSGGQIWGYNTGTITVSGLAANTAYKLAVMAMRPNAGSVGEITAGGTTLTSGPHSAPDLNPVNWAVFDSVTTSPGGVLTFTLATKPGTDPWNQWYLEAFQVVSYDVLPSATDVRIASTATLDLNACLQTIASLADSDSSGGSVTNSATDTTAILTINPLSGSTAFSGVIAGGSGSINLVKSGAGTQVLSGANTYTGKTTVTVGTLSLGGSGVLGGGSYAGTLSIASGATLNYDSSASQALSGTISGAGGLTKTGAGTLSLAGANRFSGGTTLTAGQLNMNSATALGTGALTLAGGTTIDNTSAGALTLSNPNAQNWNGDFTFGGSHALNLGLGAVTISTSRTVTVAGSTLKVGGVISGSGSLTKAGSGTLDLQGASSYTGDTVVSGGTLWLNACSLLNVQFSRDANKAYTGQGYVPNLGNNTWNFLRNVNTSSSLNYANGQPAAGLSVWVSGIQDYDGQGADASLSGGQAWGTGTATITVSGLQANTAYKLAVMAMRPNAGSVGEVTAGGTTLTSGPHSAPDLNPVNWAVFNSVTTSAGGVLTFTIANKPGTDPWTQWYLEAFQLEPVTDRVNVLPATTTLQIASPGVVALTGSNTVSRLYLDGAGRSDGTWGSPESSAAHKNSHFTGTGILVVRQTTGGGTRIFLY